jgi:hypothetical protein
MKRIYPPSRSAAAVREKARSAWGRKEDLDREAAEEAEAAAEVQPGADLIAAGQATKTAELPLASGQVAKDTVQKARIDPLTGREIPRTASDGVPKSGTELLKAQVGMKLAPPSDGAIDRDASESRYKDAALREPTPVKVVRGKADDHGWPDDLARTWCALVRHGYRRKEILFGLMFNSPRSVCT